MQLSRREVPVQDYGFHTKRETFRTAGVGDSEVIYSTIKSCVKEGGRLFKTPLGLDKPLVLVMGIGLGRDFILVGKEQRLGAFYKVATMI